MTSNIFNDISQTTQSAQSYSSAPTTVKVTDVMPSIPAASTMDTDKVDLTSAKKTKEKRGPIKAFKAFIANIKKGVATFNEYSKGFFKGIKNGAIFASLIYTGGSVINKIAAITKKKNPAISNKAIVITSAVSAIASLGVSLWKSSLNASEKRSDIEHRWTGHV